MAQAITPTLRTAFYRSALQVLRTLDARERTPRRFGPDPDARWDDFAGHLGTASRLDLLVRDAAASLAPAFSPAAIFQLPGLATDEPFGPDWAPLPEHEARTLWRTVTETGDLASVAVTLGIREQPVTLPTITPSTRLVVAGGAATLAVARHFEAHPQQSWGDQVVVVADAPAVRQLAALAAPLLRSRKPTKLRTSQAPAQVRGALTVVSADATTAERLAAQGAR